MMLTRVYRDKWIWAFLILGGLTFGAALNAALNARLARRTMDRLYEREVQSDREREAIRARQWHLEREVSGLRESVGRLHGGESR